MKVYWDERPNLPEGVFGVEDRRVMQTPEVSLNKGALELNVKMHVLCFTTGAVNLSNYLHDLARHSLLSTIVTFKETCKHAPNWI